MDFCPTGILSKCDSDTPPAQHITESQLATDNYNKIMNVKEGFRNYGWWGGLLVIIILMVLLEIIF